MITRMAFENLPILENTATKKKKQRAFARLPTEKGCVRNVYLQLLYNNMVIFVKYHLELYISPYTGNKTISLLQACINQQRNGQEMSKLLASPSIIICHNGYLIKRKYNIYHTAFLLPYNV